MKYNWVDIGLAILILLSFYRGYKAGFLKSIFSLIGDLILSPTHSSQLEWSVTREDL
jgi:hypothetical protein